MAGNLIISLDFELMWGLRDHRTIENYGDAVLGAREVIPKILNLFEEYDVSASWATVGFLFARDRQELEKYKPKRLPIYENASLSPYGFIDRELKECEKSDPAYYASSLINLIASTPGQEICTHTFSHYYCLEKGPSLEAFDADLKAAIELARLHGHELQSIVFPRNQMSNDHLSICAQNGIKCFRGNQGGFAYRSRAGDENTPLVRAVRLLDGIVPVSGWHDFQQMEMQTEMVNVQASRFLRPWNNKFPIYSKLHALHVCREIRRAARLGRNYHLWWHPHNMGRNQEMNIKQLRSVLDCFSEMRDVYDMKSSKICDFLPLNSILSICNS